MSVVVLNNNPFFFLFLLHYISLVNYQTNQAFTKRMYMLYLIFLVLGAQNSRESGIGNVIFIQSECLLLPFDLWA